MTLSLTWIFVLLLSGYWFYTLYRESKLLKREVEDLNERIQTKIDTIRFLADMEDQWIISDHEES